MRGYIIKTDGSFEEVDAKLHEKNGSLQALYDALDCALVERVTLKHGEIWCDEEGLLNRKELNRLATVVWHTDNPLVGQPLVGTVFLRLRKGYKLTDDGVVRDA